MGQEEYREMDGKRERDRESKERDRLKSGGIKKVGTRRHEDVSDW